MKTVSKGLAAAVLVVTGLTVSAGPARAEVDLQSLLREGLLGAGVGAISAGVGKGNAGTGALVGAGTQIIGGSLLSFLTTPSSSQGRTVYAQQQQVVAAQPVYYTQAQPVYTQPVYSQPAAPEPVYTYSQPSVPVYTYSAPAASQDESGKKILKQGLLGAGVGALSAGVGKGNAGTGALVGAGTSVIGGALFDFLTGPSASSQTQPVYYTTNIQPARTAGSSSIAKSSAWGAGASNLTQRRIVRTYDAEGNLVSEEEFWQ
jgi:hypothetical protein